jgi:phosphate transport system substrate-binding protein
MRRVSKILAVAGTAAAIGLVGRGAAANVDPQLPDYTTVSGVSGNLTSVGSDTLNNLMTFWAEAFNGFYPNVNMQIEGKGSSTAPPALISGASNFGPMSREMKAEEIQQFEKKFGYKPTGIRVALDALAVYVNKDNPIEKLTMAQVDAIFSSTRKGGAPADLSTWGQLGLTGAWASLPISLYGRNSASGTYGYFKEHVLAKGDYKSTVKEQPGSAAVVQGVTADRGGIGYSGIGYKTAGVKAVPIVGKDGATYDVKDENVYSGKYPISRALYIYVNKGPGQPLQPAVREFLKFVLSKQGQEVVVKDGYVPLPATLAAEERAKLN